MANVLPQSPKKAIAQTETPSSQNLQLSRTGLYSERSSWQSSISSSSSSSSPKALEISTTFLRHLIAVLLAIKSGLESRRHTELIVSSWRLVKFWTKFSMFRMIWTMLLKPQESSDSMAMIWLIILLQGWVVAFPELESLQTLSMNSTLSFVLRFKSEAVKMQSSIGIDTLNVNLVEFEFQTSVTFDSRCYEKN